MCANDTAACVHARVYCISVCKLHILIYNICLSLYTMGSRWFYPDISSSYERGFIFIFKSAEPTNYSGAHILIRKEIVDSSAGDLGSNK